MGYNNKNSHINCPTKCFSCKERTCNDFGSKLKCVHCGVRARSDICLKTHLDVYCRVANKCSLCEQYNHPNHVCVDQKYCVNCKTAVEKVDHKCFLKTENEKKNTRKSMLKGL